MAGNVIEDSYLKVMREVVGTKNERGELYRVEPKDIVPVEVLEGILFYKATRAYNAKDNKKKRDELIDVINYAAFVIARLDLNAEVLPKIKESVDRVHARNPDKPAQNGDSET